MEPESGKTAATESTKRKRAKAKPAASEEDLGIKKQEDVKIYVPRILQWFLICGLGILCVA
jgi:hypothetical protein